MRGSLLPCGKNMAPQRFSAGAKLKRERRAPMLEIAVNSDSQVVGEQLAKRVATHAAAIDAINTSEHPFSLWHLCALAALVAGNLSLGGHAASTAMFAVGGVAQLGLVFALDAHVKCLKLRKRIDAALVLLQENESR